MFYNSHRCEDVGRNKKWMKQNNKDNNNNSHNNVLPAKLTLQQLFANSQLLQVHSAFILNRVFILILNPQLSTHFIHLATVRYAEDVQWAMGYSEVKAGIRFTNAWTQQSQNYRSNHMFR